MTPLEVPTSVAPAVPTPTVFTVPPRVLPAYPAPAPVEPTVYQTPPPPGPTVYPAPAAPMPSVPTVYPAFAPAVPVAPFPVPPPIVPPVMATHIDPTIPPAVYAPVYAATPRVPPPVYSAVPPIAPAPGIQPVPASIPTHLTDIVTARTRIPTLAESMKKLVAEDSFRMQQFIQELDGHLQVKLAGFGNSSYIETLDRALMIESAHQRAYLDKKKKQTNRTLGKIQPTQAAQQQSGRSRPETTSPQPALRGNQFAIIANCLGTRIEIVR
ncbi:proline-rich receptor-like protein kinase PERK2 [Zingiber officinale]|uniref:proline-rich receptor-like protein kinase PERK2 n=1 Tax=Zingiber officinale TaxID=94328 RepID=UPI001C4B028C|nr:proline-rich receptor-like protein kinase PERK2 [Zingiber officinale]